MTIISKITLGDYIAPEGTVVDSYRVTLSNGQVVNVSPASVVDGTTTASFDVTTPGKYTVIVAAVAADGTGIGAPIVSNEVEIAAPVVPTTITVSVPVSVVLSLA